MQAIYPYLSFNGNCREAMEFYAEALGGDLHILTYAEAPGDPAPGGDRVMHARVTSGAVVLMASDMPLGKSIVEGEDFSLSVACNSREEADRLCHAVSAGGTVTMPMQDTFWGAYFGMVRDRFGIRWMFDYTSAPS